MITKTLPAIEYVPRCTKCGKIVDPDEVSCEKAVPKRDGYIDYFPTPRCCPNCHSIFTGIVVHFPRTEEEEKD